MDVFLLNSNRCSLAATSDRFLHNNISEVGSLKEFFVAEYDNVF